MCAIFCSFCKKSASKLVPHYLCDCCLVHLECCEATPENRWATLAKTIIPDEEDPTEKVDCDICLEKYPEDELEEHRDMCTARVVLRCSVCDGDYVNKEGLWNHLDQHEIADESKELHYQEMRATYKLYKCVLCNDQRGYQESIYWRHVHEDHDGFFLRCLDCGENFRSEKRKTDHALSHCNAGKQSETSDYTALELDEEIGILFLPELELPPEKHDDNLISPLPEVSTKNCELESLTLPEKFDFHLKNGDLTYDDEENVDSRFSKDPPEGNCDGDIVDNDTMELKIEGDISQPSLEKTSIVTNDEKCSHCDKEFNDKMTVARHIEYCHQPITCDICGITVDNRSQIQYHKHSHSKPCYKCAHCPMAFNFKSLYQRHLVKHEKERKFPCALCESKFKSKFGLSLHMKRVHKLSQATTELGTDCDEQQLENGNEQVVDSIPPKLEITVEDTKVCLAIEDTSIVDEPSQVDGNTLLPSAEECSIVAEEKQSSDPLEISQIKQESPDGTSKVNVMLTDDIDDNKCTHCPRLCHDKKELSTHYYLCHMPTECKICNKTIVGKKNYRYHKLSHAEPRHKCPHCQQTFHEKIALRRHLSVHQNKKEVSCDWCDLKFKSSAHVDLHKKRVHSAKDGPCRIPSSLTRCPVCGDNFDDEHDLSQHIRANHQMTFFTCCESVFTTILQLKNHKQKYHSIPKYSCKQCHQSFNVRTIFDKHLSACSRKEIKTGVDFAPE